jgi:hypothetical protein
MKKIIITLSLICVSLNLIFAQLTLQKVNSKKTLNIPDGSEIRLKTTTKSNPSEFEPFHLYSGTLTDASKDSVTLILSSEQLTFTNVNNIIRNSFHSYKYSADNRIATRIPVKDLLSINKVMKSGKSLNALAGGLMALAAFNQLFLSPFFSAEIRKTSDRISAGAFGVGLVLAIVPKSKTYHIKQPKEGNKTLWKL